MIIVPDMDLYSEVEAALRDNQVRIFAASPKRGMLSTGPLPEDLTSFVQERGGSLTPEFQYDLEAGGPERTAAR